VTVVDCPLSVAVSLDPGSEKRKREKIPKRGEKGEKRENYVLAVRGS